MLFGLIDSSLLGKCLLIFGTIVFAIVYQCIIRYWSFFNKNNVKFVRGWPMLGSMTEMVRGRESFATNFQKFYKQFSTERIFGMFELFGTPVYVIRDPVLFKQITIKDFDHFANHRSSIGEGSDPLLSRSLPMMRDNRWRVMRSTLSPAFTGSKMRLMLSLVSECSKKFSDQLLSETRGSPKVYDLKDLFTRYTSDSIATSVFGLEINSLQDRDNEFFSTGAEVTNFSGSKGLKIFGFTSCPRVMNWLKIRFFTDEQSSFFRNLVHGNMNYRDEHNIVRHDMINLLMEAKKGNLKHTSGTDDDKDIGYATVEESDVGKSSQTIQRKVIRCDEKYISFNFFFCRLGR